MATTVTKSTALAISLLLVAPVAQAHDGDLGILVAAPVSLIISFLATLLVPVGWPARLGALLAWPVFFLLAIAIVKLFVGPPDGQGSEMGMPFLLGSTAVGVAIVAHFIGKRTRGQ